MLVIDEKLAASIVFRLRSTLSEGFFDGPEISFLGLDWNQTDGGGVLGKSCE